MSNKTVILRCAPQVRLDGGGPGARAVALRGSLRSHLRVTEQIAANSQKENT